MYIGQPHLFFNFYPVFKRSQQTFGPLVAVVSGDCFLPLPFSRDAQVNADSRRTCDTLVSDSWVNSLCVARRDGIAGVSHGEKEMPLILRGEAKTGRGEKHGAWPDLSGASEDIEKMEGR